jgi:Antitoxin Phd_YefM, type II toxin-antitoxin system
VVEIRVFYDVSGTTVEILAIVAKSGAESLARTVRRSGMKEVPLSEIKDDLSRFLREAETQEIVITRHGKPAGVQARNRLCAGRGTRLEDIETE